MLSILNQYPLLREKIIKQHHVRSLLLLLLYHCSIHIIKNKITFWHFLLAFYEQAMTLIYYLVTSSNNVMWIPRYLEDLNFLTIFCLLCILFYFKNWRLYSIVLFNPDLFFLKLRLFHSFYFFIKSLGPILFDIFTWNLLHSIIILQTFTMFTLNKAVHLLLLLALIPQADYFITRNSIIKWTVIQFEVSKVFLAKKKHSDVFFDELE